MQKHNLHANFLAVILTTNDCGTIVRIPFGGKTFTWVPTSIVKANKKLFTESVPAAGNVGIPCCNLANNAEPLPFEVVEEIQGRWIGVDIYQLSTPDLRDLVYLLYFAMGDCGFTSACAMFKMLIHRIEVDMGLINGDDGRNNVDLMPQIRDLQRKTRSGASHKD